jgi:single-stranded-DNA-specific exonuclease
MERGEIESTGSARSVPSFNVVEALKYSKDVLVKFGGHAAAAGFTLRTEHLDIFYKNLLDFADKNLDPAALAKVINLDAEMKPEDISMETSDTINAFEPFGVDNTKPKFMLANVSVVDSSGVGKDAKHLQLSVSAKLGNGTEKVFKCIAFNFCKVIEQLSPGKKIDLAFELITDVWQGRKNLKLRVIDFREAQNG